MKIQSNLRLGNVAWFTRTFDRLYNNKFMLPPSLGSFSRGGPTLQSCPRGRESGRRNGEAFSAGVRIKRNRIVLFKRGTVGVAWCLLTLAKHKIRYFIAACIYVSYTRRIYTPQGVEGRSESCRIFFDRFHIEIVHCDGCGKKLNVFLIFFVVLICWIKSELLWW